MERTTCTLQETNQGIPQPEITESVLHFKVEVTSGPARLLRATLEAPEEAIGQDGETPEIVEVPDFEPTADD